MTIDKLKENIIAKIIYFVFCSYIGYAGKDGVIAFKSQNHHSSDYRKRANSTDTSRGSVIKPGSMTPEQALKYVKAHPNAKLPHSNSNIDTSKISDFSPIIDSTDGNSKYDAGYIAGNGESLKEYRKRNREAVIKGNIELIAKVIFVIVFLTGLVFLIRLILRNWAVIRKFFLG
jgi:hypothetical protein